MIKLLRIALVVSLLAVAAVLLPGGAAGLPACTVTWDGPASGGDWSTAANWDTNVLPASGDHVCIAAGNTVTHSTGTTSVQSVNVAGILRITGGTLNLTYTTEPSAIATLQMSGGALGGPAAVNVSGSSTWSGGTMRDAGTTTVPAGSTLTTSAFVSLADGRHLDIAGLLVMGQSGSIGSFGTPEGIVHNTGEIRGTATSFGVSLDPELDNDGTVVAQSTTLDLNGGSGAQSSTGAFGAAAATGTVRFNSGTHVLGDGARWRGGVELRGGVVSVADGAAATAAGSNAMSGGKLGGTGSMSLGGTFAWSGGTMGDAGTTTIPAGATLTTSAFVSLADGRTLENAGLLVMGQSGSIGSFGTAEGFVHNTGEIRGTATSFGVSFDPVLDNDGTVVAQSTTLDLNGGSGTESSSGDFGAAAAGGTVRFNSGVHVLGDGARWLGGVELRGGELSVADAAAATAAGPNKMSGGTLSGPGSMALGGAFTWSGGTMRGPGTTTVPVGATLTTSAFVSLADGRRLDNAGLFVLGQSGSLGSFGTTEGSVHNTGEIRGAATSFGVSFDAELDNDGTVLAQSTTLDLNGGSGSATSSGDFGAASAGGTVRFNGGVHTLAGGARWLGGVELRSGRMNLPAGTLTAPGTNAITGGTLGGAGTVSVPGTLRLSGGTMTDSGLTRILGTGKLELTGTSSVSEGRRIQIDGLMDVQGDRFLNSFGAVQPSINNTAGGIIRKSSGTGTANIFAPVKNDGLVESTAGRLELEGDATVTDTGTFKGASETALPVFAGGTNVLADSVDIEGWVEIGFGGTVEVPGGATLDVDDQLVQSGGTLGGAGTVNVPGLFKWTDGDQAGPGTTLVPVGGTLLVDGSSFSCGVSLSAGRLLDNRGTVSVVSGATISAFDDPRPVIENSGRLEFDDSDAGTCGDAGGISGNALVHNTGTIEKLGGTGQVRIEDNLDNDGDLIVTSGSAAVSSGSALTHSGAFQGNGGPVVFSFGEFDLGPGATIDGNVDVEGADLVLPEQMTLTVGSGDVLRLLGGSITGGDLDVLGGGSFIWREGRRGGSGTTTIAPAATVELGPENPDDFGFGELDRDHALVNQGTLRLRGGGFFVVNDGASIRNSGTFELQGGTSLEGSDAGIGSGFRGLVHNTGTLRKVGATESSVGVAIDNDGTLEVAAGELLTQRLLNWSTAGFSGDDGSLTGGTWIVRDTGRLIVPGSLRVNAAQVVLDGPGSQILYEGQSFPGPTFRDAFEAFTRNAPAGRLEVLGGRELILAPELRNDGTLRIGPGSLVTANGGYRQTSSGAVLRTVLTTPAASGKLRAPGATATLGGRLTPEKGAGFAPALGQDYPVIEAPTVTGTFASVTGTSLGGGLALQPRYEAPGMKLRVVNAPAPTLAEPTGDAPAPKDEGGEALRVKIDDRALQVTSGSWTRTQLGGTTATVTRESGASLVRRGLKARRLVLVAYTCRRCGSLAVYFRGRLIRRVALNSHRPGRRALRIATFKHARRGTLRLRTTSSRRVAIDAVVAIRPRDRAPRTRPR